MCNHCRQWSEVVKGVMWECGHCGYDNSPRLANTGIMPDIQPYKSMIDGSMITSRSHHRAHLKQHNCVEVGNDPSIMNAKRKPLEAPPGLKETLIRVANEKLR